MIRFPALLNGLLKVRQATLAEGGIDGNEVSEGHIHHVSVGGGREALAKLVRRRGPLLRVVVLVVASQRKLTDPLRDVVDGGGGW
jgi:hypothetical protein